MLDQKKSKYLNIPIIAKFKNTPVYRIGIEWFLK